MVWELPKSLDDLAQYLDDFVMFFNNLRAAKNRSLATIVVFALEDGGYAEVLLVDKSSTSSFIQTRPVDIHTFNDNTILEMNRNLRQKEFDNRGELIYAIALNRGIIAELGSSEAFARTVAAELEKPQPAKVPASSQSTGVKVLIVHGRDHATRDAIELYVRDLGLQTRRMDAEAHEGRSLPEKWEEVASDIGYAVFIVTADDELKIPKMDGEAGAAIRDEETGETIWKDIRRPRQNVILEMGYVWGAIGRRKKTAFLVDRRVSGLELPNDIQGIGLIPITNDLAETKLQLRRELAAAGFL